MGFAVGRRGGYQEPTDSPIGNGSSQKGNPAPTGCAGLGRELRVSVSQPVPACPRVRVPSGSDGRRAPRGKARGKGPDHPQAPVHRLGNPPWVRGAGTKAALRPARRTKRRTEAVPLAIDGKDLIRGSEFSNSFYLSLLEGSLCLAPGELPLPGQRSHWEPPSLGSRSSFASALSQGGVPTALTQGP